MAPFSWWKRIALCLSLTVVGWLGAMGIPPMQSPDENHHLARAYMLARGQWTLFAPPGKMSGGMIDKNLAAYSNIYMQIPGRPGNAVSHEEKVRASTINWSDSESQIFFEAPGTGYYFPLVYAPHATSLWLAQKLDFTIEHSYYFVRFIVLFASISFIILAFEILPPNATVLALLMLPMTVFQLLSPTLDGLSVGLLLLFLAHFSRVWKVGSGSLLPTSIYIYLLAILFVLATSRVYMIALIGLFFVACWRDRSWGGGFLGLLFLALCGTWFMYAASTVVDYRVQRTLGTFALFRIYLLAPWDFFSLVMDTLLTASIREFYARSFIGILGWLDAPLRNVFYPVIGVGLVGSCALSMRRSNDLSDTLLRFLLSLVCTISLSLIFFALLVTWTPSPPTVIEGVQGRYFLMPALLAAYALSGFDSATWFGQGTMHRRRIIKWGFVLVLGAICLFALETAVRDRFG